MTYPLFLGDVRFKMLEIPEKIGPLGGKQVLVIHEYPGGAREVDDIGAFPLPISWRGIFTGTDAFDRAAQVDRMRTTGLDVTFQYGPQSMLGKIARFEYMPNHQFFIPYSIRFEPILDLSGVGTLPFSGASLEQQMGVETSIIGDIIDGDDGLLLPDDAAVAAQVLLDAVSLGLLDGNGTVVGISTANVLAISAAAAVVQTTCVPYIAGINPAIASPSLDLSARAAAIAILVSAQSTGSRQLQTINPNLFSLAAQYYGDATRWQEIATASGLSDPQPIGQFTITVPA